MKITKAVSFKKPGGEDFSPNRISTQLKQIGVGIDMESAAIQLQDVLTADSDCGKSVKLFSDAQINAGLAIKNMFSGGDYQFESDEYLSLHSSTDGISNYRGHGFQGFDKRPQGFDLESYSGDTRDRFIDYSVDFNAGAARQDAFGEGFFRTIVVATDIDAVNMEITLPVVYDRHTHKVGDDFAYYQRTTIHALVDPTILKSSVVKLIPSVTAESAGVFVDDSVVNNRVINVDGADITTNYLKASTEINWLAISNRPNAIGAHDTTDTIDGARVNVALYRIGTGKVLAHNVSKAPSAAFLRRENGKENDMVLTSSDLTMTLDANTAYTDGTLLNAAAPFDVLGTSVQSIRISYKLTGSLNSQTSVGSVSTATSEPKIQRITDMSGNTISLSDASITALVAALKTIRFFGFEPDANVDNKNRRQQGKLVDAHTFKDRYQILFGQPLTSMRSTFQKGGEDGHKGVQALVDTQRATNSNNAVAALQDYVEALQVFGAEGAAVNIQALDELPGLARRVMKPWCLSKTADVLEHVQSLRSSDLLNDISAYLLNNIAAQVFRAYNDSWYSAALSHFSNNSNEQPRPRVIIGTTPEIAAYLNRIGDSRLLGDLFETKVVVSPNADLEGMIYWTFGQEATGDASPMESGWFFWSPELLGDINISSAGQTSAEVICVPRTAHIKNTPVVGVIVVENLAEAAVARVEFKTSCCETTEETPPEEEPVTP